MLKRRVPAHHPWRMRQLLLIHAAALALTACGGTSPSTPAPAPIPPPPTTDPTPKPVNPNPVNPNPVNPTPVTPVPNDGVDEAEYDKTGAAQIKARQIWAKGYTGKGILVGVIDSGIDSSSSEFSGRIHPSSYDFVNNTANLTDKGGHGTAVSSIIGAARDKKGVIGVAYNATIFLGAAGTCDKDGVCKGISPNAANKAIKAMMDAGVRVINESYSTENLGTTEADLVSQATAKGIIIVTSAGNEHEEISRGKRDMIDLRTGHGLVVLVGALDSKGALAVYSNTPGEAGKYNFICAPGYMNILTPADSQYNGQIRPGAGTSFASPVVVGAIALIMEAWPKMISGDIVDLIYHTADDLGEKGVDTIYGWGALNIVRAFDPYGTTAYAGTDIVYDSAEPQAYSGPAWGNGQSLSLSMRDVLITDAYHRDFHARPDRAMLANSARPWLAQNLQQTLESSHVGDARHDLAYQFAPSPLGWDRATEQADQRDLRAGYAPAALGSLRATWQITPRSALGFATGGTTALAQTLGLSMSTPALMAADMPDMAQALGLHSGTSLAAATSLAGWRIGALASRAQSARSRARWGLESRLNSYSLHALRQDGAWTRGVSVS